MIYKMDEIQLFDEQSSDDSNTSYKIMYIKIASYIFVYLLTFLVFLPLSLYIYDEYWIQNHIMC